MDESLEELRAQRELIKKHLDWLDREIAKSHGTSPRATEAKTLDSTPEALPLPSNSPLLSESKEANIKAEASASTETEIPTPIDVPELRPSNMKSDILRAKIGCSLFFGIGILLFIFVLFGSYIMDWLRSLFS